MARDVFTEFVYSLDLKPEPDVEDIVPVWEALRKALRRELRRRGLRRVSPRLLGIFGWPTWEQGESRALTSTGAVLLFPRDALDELVADCYVYNFVVRLRSLRAQLKGKPSIDGQVYRNVRHFVTEAQRRNDPLGYRVYSLLRRALEQAIGMERIFVLEDGPRIVNSSIFSFEPTTEPDQADGSQLDGAVRGWVDELLPELVSARGEQEEAVVVRLESLITSLGRTGVPAFRFHDVVQPLKLEIRARWEALLGASVGDAVVDTGDGNLANLVRYVAPDLRIEERERFEKLAHCVERRIGRWEGRRRTREYLQTLWRFLRVFALMAEDDATLPEGAPTAAAAERIPSKRELARLLKIPRDRIDELVQELRPMVEKCREALTRLTEVRPRWRDGSKPGAQDPIGEDRGDRGERGAGGHLQRTLLRLSVDVLASVNGGDDDVDDVNGGGDGSGDGGDDPGGWVGSSRRRRRRVEPAGPSREQLARFVFALDHGALSAGDIAEMRRILRTTLRREIHRRGLWDLSPSLLGVFGWRSWRADTPVYDGPSATTRDALDELVADCYTYNFVDRFRTYRVQHEKGMKDQVARLFQRNVRHFVGEEQRRNDPLGYRVFELLRKALRHASVTGCVFVLKEGPIGSDTVFGFAADGDPSELHDVRLAEIVRSWSAELMPALVTSREEEESAVVCRLQELVMALEGQDVQAFAFSHVVRLLKSEALERWLGAPDDDSELDAVLAEHRDELSQGQP